MKKKAVLFIHGFMGHPKEYKILKELFTSWHYDTYEFVLSGHDGGKIKHVTKEEWEKDCIKNIDLLKEKGYENIILVGHSMGGVLGTSMTLKYKEYISKLILIDPAFEYLIMKDGKLKIFPSIVQAVKIFKDKANKERTSQAFRCTPKAIKEFRSLVKEHKDDIYKVKCPIMFLHGDHDYVVPIEAIRNIYEKIENKNKRLIEVKNGSHWRLSTKLEDDIYNKIKEFLSDEK